MLNEKQNYDKINIITVLKIELNRLFLKGGDGMPVDYREFIHPSDKKALEALRKVPGFDIVCKKFTEEITERQYKIFNMSSHIKLGPDQLPEIYNLLPPICEKLGIPEPDLYLALNRSPNAYTVGDTSICIVINSGLIETMTLEEVQTVLAHECGHIICRHVLYHTMASWLFSLGTSVLSNFGWLSLLSYPLYYAFYYWIRCSEYSADRASAWVQGGSKPVVDVMLRLSGASTTLNSKINRELYLQQAKDYKHQMNESGLNKLFELWMMRYDDHPFTAYRAYELSEWCKTDEFLNIKDHLGELPEEYLNDRTKNVHLDIDRFEYVDGKVLTSWFKDRVYLYGKQKISIHCGMSNKDFSYLGKLKVDMNKAIYQSILSKDNIVLAHRILEYKDINKDLENMFANNDGIIVVE